MKNIYKKIISGLWELVAGGFYFFSFLYCKYLYMNLYILNPDYKKTTTIYGSMKETIIII